MKKVLVLAGSALTAAAMAATLLNAGIPAVMPARRAELEPGYDMNDLIDLEGKAERKKKRKAHLKEAQARAFGS